MASKSSDGESRDKSSSDLELTDLMESVGSFLGKRKAETPNSDDSGESEKNSTDETEGDGEEEEEDEDEDSEENDFVKKNPDDTDTEPEWGYDSFDEYEDNSCEQRMDSNDEEADELEMQQWRHYQRQLIETKGFFNVTDKFPRRVIGGIASFRDLDEPTILGITGRQLCENLTCLCLERYKEKKVKLVYILRVNWNVGSMSKFYITFAARESESPDAPLVEYQAKAAYTIKRKAYPILCRPSPPYPILCSPTPPLRRVREETG